MLFRAVIITIVLSISSCSSWVYRIDIPQGNYLEQKNIDKIQITMTKEQVKFILGSPVIIDAFDKDTWNYVYNFKSGRSKDLNVEKRFIIKFKDNSLISADGDFELSGNFYTPFNATVKNSNTEVEANSSTQNMESK